MYQFLIDHFGVRFAYWGTLVWYILLITVLFLSIGLPAGEFRYGDI